MPPIDASIYGQFAPRVQSPVEIQNGLMQGASSALNMQHQRMQMEQTQADMADTNALRAAYRGGADPSTPEGRQALIQAAPLQAPKIFQQQADLAKTGAETNQANAHAADFASQVELRKIQKVHDQTTLMAQQLSAAKGPADVIPIVTQHVESGFLDKDKAIAEFDQMPKQPGPEFDKWKAAKLQEAVPVLEQQKQAFEQVKLASEEKRAAATNQTSLQRVSIEQAGANSRNAANIAKDYAVAGVGPGGALGDDQKALVDAIGQYKVQPPTGMALRNPRMQTILAQVAEKYPNFDATQYGARQVAAKSFSTGKDGQAIQSANTALNHLDTISQLADAQKNGDIRLFNQIANRIATETGGTAPTNLQAAVTMVGPEISKAVIGAGGGQGDRDKVDAALASLVKGGPAQAAGTVATMKDLFGGRLTEAERTYKRTTGRDDFADTFLSPAAQGVLAAKKGAPAGHPPEINDLLKKYGK